MKILILIALFGLCLNVFAEEPTLEERRVAVCEKMLTVAQFAREGSLRGQASAMLTYVRAEYTGYDEDMYVKTLRWGFAYKYHTKEQLTEAYMKECTASVTGPIGMSEVRDL